MMMVDGFGWVWKCWVIICVEECKSYFLWDGVLCKIEFFLFLKSYGFDCSMDIVIFV